ncbi:MAG: hypothetical protein IJL26_07030 [Clostridia bacterium]|nr:hypothetical protein [Clostridia bacterium]
MGYIRKREEELTCYQESAPLLPETDFGNDMVCVYGIDPGMPERVKKYRERGYVVHLMNGIAWGWFPDYMSGQWDGREHYDEMQRSRDGSITGEFCHSSGYMVPTVSFTDYLTEKLKVAVDAGVEAIHVEEPEFLNDGGYSDAFKREYKLFYHEDWVPPHESVDAHYRAARLKAWLYRRAIERVSQSLREYALVKYDRVLRFYVPTHSLLNYSQWKVMSPEGTLTDIPSLDGYKAQVWMGTSREANVFHGVYKERTFETAFLEYGVMQELVRGTGRTMWFDNDPIEDRSDYTWENYRRNYIETLMGSLLQPKINRFQICPWPRRIFSGEAKYPKDQPDAAPIPESYRTFLMNVFQMLGTFGTEDYEYLRKVPQVGVFLSDTAMFQRNFPDDILAKRAEYAPVGRIELLGRENYIPGREREITSGDRLRFLESVAFPLFYGLALPLLKGGFPVRPVQLENITRYPSYLDDYRLLVLSYEFMKPQGADVNVALANYVRDGGILVYVGDGTDPFHKIRAWWNTGKNADKTPLEHLLRLLGLPEDAPDGEYGCGGGKFVLLRKCPADLCVNTDDADRYASLVGRLIGVSPDANDISLRRGEYIVSAVMDECASDAPLTHEGLYADMLDNDFAVITKKTLRPGEYAVLMDLNRIPADTAVVGTSIRVNALDVDETGFSLTGCGADCDARMRLRLPKAPRAAQCEITPAESDGAAKETEIAFEWDGKSRTVLLKFRNTAGKTVISGRF